jgi:hypothetical protein
MFLQNGQVASSHELIYVCSFAARGIFYEKALLGMFAREIASS